MILAIRFNYPINEGFVWISEKLKDIFFLYYMKMYCQKYQISEIKADVMGNLI